MAWELKEVALVWGAFNLVLFGLGLVKPEGFRKAFESFPRHTPSGYVLAVIALVWSAWLVNEMPLGGFNQYKNVLYIITPVTIAATFMYMNELLAPRALGGVLLLLSSPILEGIRWHESSLRLVVTTLTYVNIIFGMILVLSPFRFRKMLTPLVEGNRLRVSSLVGLLIGGLLMGIGLTA